MSKSTTTLIAGSNTALSNDPTLEITVEWPLSPNALDVSCFMVNEQGKVPSDDYFIFYNQAVDPQQIIQFEPVTAQSVKFTIKLEALLASAINKCVFAATLDGKGTFADMLGCRITATTASHSVVYEINEAKAETSLVLLEVYRHNGWFKLRAIGRGFNGGLRPLAEAHGVIVEEPEIEAEASITQEPTPSSNINLNKIDLLKKKVRISLEKKKLDKIKARVSIVIDASGSMTDLYNKGTVQRAFEKILAVAACMDDDGVMDVWFFASKAKRTQSVTESDYEDYVKKTYSGPKMFGGLGIGNNEPVVMKDIIKKYTIEEPSDLIPTYIIFISDGGIYEGGKISKLLIESSKSSIFWQFVGLGNADFGVLEKLDNLQGRFIDNANFFALSDLDMVSDEELYDRLLNEFPGWIRQAKEKGILRNE